MMKLKNFNKVYVKKKKLTIKIIILNKMNKKVNYKKKMKNKLNKK